MNVGSQNFAYLRVASTLQPDTGMDDPAPAAETPEGQVVHTFTVLRGMAVALVIETRDWYSGLLQAALARVRIEGRNSAGCGGRGRSIPPAGLPLFRAQHSRRALRHAPELYAPEALGAARGR